MTVRDENEAYKFTDRYGDVIEVTGGLPSGGVIIGITKGDDEERNAAVDMPRDDVVQLILALAAALTGRS